MKISALKSVIVGCVILSWRVARPSLPSLLRRQQLLCCAGRREGRQAWLQLYLLHFSSLIWWRLFVSSTSFHSSLLCRHGYNLPPLIRFLHSASHRMMRLMFDCVCLSCKEEIIILWQMMRLKSCGLCCMRLWSVFFKVCVLRGRCPHLRHNKKQRRCQYTPLGSTAITVEGTRIASFATYCELVPRKLETRLPTFPVIPYYTFCALRPRGHIHPRLSPRPVYITPAFCLFSSASPLLRRRSNTR